jgi:hypothetical protein
MNGTINALLLTGAIGLLLALFLFLWNIERKINYTISYSSMVQHQINKSLEEHVKKYHSQK